MEVLGRWGRGVAATVATTTALLAVAAPGHDPFTLADTTWARWDSGLYYTIARDGYSLMPCPGGSDPGGPWCGTAGWFPGYPAVVRLVGRLVGGELYRVGAAIALACWLVTVVLVGRVLAAQPLRRSWPAWLLLAAFPGAVYYRAVFPISMATLGTAAMLLGLRHRRYVVTALGGAAAAVAYPSGLLTAAGCFPLWRRAWRREPGALRQALVATSGPVLGYLAVLALFRVRLGRWDAWFLVQEKYGHGVHDPLTHLWWVTAPLRDSASGRPVLPALQTVLVAVLVVAALLAARREGFAAMADESVGAAAIVAVLWLAPLTIGGQQLSLYRAEALLVPLCLLWPMVRGPHRWILPVASAGLFVGMAALFFDKTLM